MPASARQVFGGALTAVSLVGLAIVLVAPPDVLPSWILNFPPTSRAPAAESIVSRPVISAPFVAPVPAPVLAPVQTFVPPRTDDWFRDTDMRAPAIVLTPAPTPVPASLPITGLRIRSAGIDTQVVEAPLVEEADGASTWVVPKFVAGHAESTAQAGETGNAVLFGHVTSLTLGNVFENLHDVHVGDLVEVDSGSTTLGYEVTEVRTIDRTDSSVVDPTDTPTLTLITCTGLWNPALHDYMQRLVVRAERDRWHPAGPY